MSGDLRRAELILMTSTEFAHTAQTLRSVWRYRRRRLLTWLVTITAGLLTSSTFADGKSLVRVTDDSQDYIGRIVALDQATCTLMDRQGRLVELDVTKLRSVKHLANRFRPDSPGDFRSQLKREFGKRYEVAGTTHYLVCGPKGHADNYAQLFERIYREMEQFYRVRGLHIQAPDVPLVAIVFAARKEFADYCLRDNVTPSAGLKGYYSLVSNRVALFVDSASFAAAGENDIRTEAIVALSGIAGQTTNTIIHETIHQVSYNVGIHSRLGKSPLWVVEGLATVLEPSAIRSRRRSQSSAQRVNSERFNWFQHQYRPGRPGGHLSQLIASDDAFRRQTLNAYSEAWAFTFFLLENPVPCRNFATYLQRLARRDPSSTYSARNRLADFQAEFGDISRLEVQFLRFMDRL